MRIFQKLVIIILLTPLAIAGCGGSNKPQSKHDPVAVISSKHKVFSNTALFASGGSSPVPGDTFHSSSGTWSNSPTSFSYQWQSCDSSGAGCSNIGGATSSSYTVVSGDVGHTLRVVVNACNTHGCSSQTSDQTDVIAGSGGGESSLSCDLNANTGNLSTQITAASPGQVICLASGNYTTIPAINKSSPGITLTSAPSATVTFNSGIDLSNNGDNLSNIQNFTVDGTGGGGTMSIGGTLFLETNSDALLNKAVNITFQNIAFVPGGKVVISGPENSNITFNRNTWVGGSATCVNGNSSGSSTFLLNYATATPTTPSGVTLENSVFVSPMDLWNPAGAIQLAAPITTINNVFTGYLAHGDAAGCTHIDTEQAFSGSPGFSSVGTFKGNLCYDDYGCLMAFDGTSANTVTDNVCFSMERACVILDSDTPGSTVDHNTMQAGGADPGGCQTLNQPLTTPVACTAGDIFENSAKSGDPAPTVETLTNNTSAAGPSTDFPDAITTNTHNMYLGASSPNINGSPTFSGGSNPSVWSGFVLSSGSTGHLAGSDGLDVGIRSTAVGPPTGGGSAPSNTVAPNLTGTASNGNVLTTTDGTWTVTGNIPTATSYQWFDCPTSTFAAGSCSPLQSFTPCSGSGCNTITNTGTNAYNTTTLTLSVGSAPSGITSGHYVFSMVTKTNANGQVNAVSNAKGPVS